MSNNLTVKPRPGESSERFIKRFCKKVKKMGFLEVLKNKRYYEKPSDIKRKKAKKARRDAEKQKKSNN